MNKKQNIGIIGLGYVGAPLAYLSSYKGYNVIGIDNNINAIERINKKTNVPIQLNNAKNGKQVLNLIATSDYSKLTDMDIIIICVPTPTINDLPDLTILNNVIENIGKFIKKGCLIILESTVAPGMTSECIKDYLFKKNNLKVDEDYDLAYCPERIDPGNNKYWVGNINRVCGGASINALERAVDFYKTIIDGKIIPMKSIEEAELIKVWENSMRNISIAQSNLLAIICDKYKFSVKEVINGLNSKVEQFGISIAYPGIGPGGHCIPEDIHYLIKTSKNDIKVNVNLLKEAVKINENMPQYILNKLLSKMKKSDSTFEKMKILMLGISYKANSSDTRRSQALALYDIIKKKNKNIDIYDPIAEEGEVSSLKTKEFEKYINETDIIIIGCAHDMFLKMDYTQYKNIKYVLDCWNTLDKEKIINAGINYIGVGE